MNIRIIAVALLLAGCGSDTQTLTQYQSKDVGISDVSPDDPSKLRTYRVKKIVLRDPHLFRDPPFFDCTDVTYSAPAGFDSANDTLEKSLVEDRNEDRLADFAVLFQIDEDELAIGNATCLLGGACEPDFIEGRTPVRFKSEGNCFVPDPTLIDFEPEPRTVSGSCFRADPVDVRFTFDKSKVLLKDALIAGEFVGGRIEGVMAAYLTLEEARLAKVRRGTLDEFLPGAGACDGGDARDDGAGFSTGWWLFIDFDAEPATIIQDGSGGGCSASGRADPSIPLLILAMLWFRRRGRDRRVETSPGCRSGSSR